MPGACAIDGVPFHWLLDVHNGVNKFRNPYLCEVTMTPSTEMLPQLYFL